MFFRLYMLWFPPCLWPSRVSPSRIELSSSPRLFETSVWVLLFLYLVIPAEDLQREFIPYDGILVSNFETPRVIVWRIGSCLSPKRLNLVGIIALQAPDLFDSALLSALDTTIISLLWDVNIILLKAFTGTFLKVHLFLNLVWDTKGFSFWASMKFSNCFLSWEACRDVILSFSRDYLVFVVLLSTSFICGLNPIVVDGVLVLFRRWAFMMCLFLSYLSFRSALFIIFVGGKLFLSSGNFDSNFFINT